MNSKILGIALFVVTLGAIVYYPSLMAKNIVDEPPIEQQLVVQRPKIDVVFVLDTTGSMSGLIQTAKEKIWRAELRSPWLPPCRRVRRWRRDNPGPNSSCRWADGDR